MSNRKNLASIKQYLKVRHKINTISQETGMPIDCVEKLFAHDFSRKGAIVTFIILNLIFILQIPAQPLTLLVIKDLLIIALCCAVASGASYLVFSAYWLHKYTE